jgi:hypothetical protein
MTRDDDLDRRIGRWMDEAAPTAAPHTLLDGTFGRTSEMTQSRARGWSPFVRLASIAAVLVVAVVAGLAAANLFDGPGVGTDMSPTASGSGALSTGTPATVTPSATATPTAPPPATAWEAPGELLLRYSVMCDVPGPVAMPRTTFLQDGRVVWLRGADDPAGESEWVVRRLSDEALDSVRAAIAGTGLLDADAQFTSEHRAGAPEPPGQGACVHAFAHRDGQTDAAISSLMWFGDEYEATYNEPDPEREALDAFAHLLADPEAWLGADAWAESEARIYRAPAYLVTSAEAFGAAPSGRDVSETAWPFDQPVAGYGDVYGANELRCGVAPAERVVAFAASTVLPDGSPVELPQPPEISLSDGGTELAINLWPQMPDGHPGCEAIY